MNWIEIILGLISGGGLVTAFTMPQIIKKAKAEAKAGEIDNILRVADGWKSLCDERQEEVREKESEVKELKAEIKTLNDTITERYVDIGAWRESNAKLQEDMAKMKVQITTIESKLCEVRNCPERTPATGY